MQNDFSLCDLNTVLKYKVKFISLKNKEVSFYIQFQIYIWVRPKGRTQDITLCGRRHNNIICGRCCCCYLVIHILLLVILQNIKFLFLQDITFCGRRCNIIICDCCLVTYTKGQYSYHKTILTLSNCRGCSPQEF